MGRPKLPEDEKRKLVSIRISGLVFRALKAEAERNGRSFQKEVELRILRSL